MIKIIIYIDTSAWSRWSGRIQRYFYSYLFRFNRGHYSHFIHLLYLKVYNVLYCIIWMYYKKQNLYTFLHYLSNGKILGGIPCILWNVNAHVHSMYYARRSFKLYVTVNVKAKFKSILVCEYLYLKPSHKYSIHNIWDWNRKTTNSSSFNICS